MATNYNYPVGCGVCLGVFHILFGLGSCGCGIAAVILNHKLSKIGSGIWAGIAFYTITGSLGLASASRNNSVVTGYYVMSLLSVFVAMGQMSLYTFITVDAAQYCHFDNYCSAIGVDSLIVSSTALILGFLEWIIAMSSACASCSCCCGNSGPPQVQTVVVHSVQPPDTGYGQHAGSVMLGHPVSGTGDGDKHIPDNSPVYVNPTYDPILDNTTTLPNTTDSTPY